MIESLAGVIKVEAIAGGVHNSSDVERASLSSQPAESGGETGRFDLPPNQVPQVVPCSGSVSPVPNGRDKKGTFH
jgi:hypothetical protein